MFLEGPRELARLVPMKERADLRPSPLIVESLFLLGFLGPRFETPRYVWFVDYGLFVLEQRTPLSVREANLPERNMPSV